MTTKTIPLILAAVLVPTLASAQTITLDTSEVRPGAVTVRRRATAVTVTWPDETSRTWTATFSLEPNRPLITSIGVGATPVVTEARPFYRGETGKRRGGWNVFFDDPTSHPEGTRHVQGTFTAARRESAQRRRARRAHLRRHAHGRLRRRSLVHVLPWKPADSAGSRPHDQ